MKKSSFKFPSSEELYNKIKELRVKGTLWSEIYENNVYEDMPHHKEVFFNAIEEEENRAIKSVKDLEKVLEIDIDDKVGKYVVKSLFESAMYLRYSTKIKSMINEGATYKDLLEILPSTFYLPKNWFCLRAYNQEVVILEAISECFLLGEPNSYVRPDLKDIATELQAPYSIIMGAFRKGRWIHKNTLKYIESLIDKRITKTAEAFIKKQTKSWRSDRMLEPKKSLIYTMTNEELIDLIEACSKEDIEDDLLGEEELEKIGLNINTNREEVVAKLKELVDKDKKKLKDIWIVKGTTKKEIEKFKKDMFIPYLIKDVKSVALNVSHFPFSKIRKEYEEELKETYKKEIELYIIFLVCQQRKKTQKRYY